MYDLTRVLRIGGNRMKKNKIQNSKPKILSGFSLMEMLVVVFVFSILGVVSTQILALSLRGSQKSESVGEVRSNVEYAVSTMERLLRNAQSINVSDSCNLSYSNRLYYTDENGVEGSFECITSSTGGYIASGSALLRITSNRVRILCSGYSIFSCPLPAGDAPQSVLIELCGEDANLGTGVEGASVTVRTQLQLRTY